MLFNKKTKKIAIGLLKEMNAAKWDKIFIKVVTILLDREKSEQDLQQEIPALEELTKDLSNPDSAKAFYILGFLHQYGLGVSLDKKLAAEYLKLAAEQGIVEAQIKLGIYLLDIINEDDDEYMGGMGKYIKEDSELGIGYLQAAEKQGSFRAKYALGCCHLLGRGVKKDLKLGIEYLKSAAAQKDVVAQSVLGALYLNLLEVEVEKDLKLAMEYFRSAAEQGDIDALNSLGYCYRTGKRVGEINLEFAVKYYRLAAEQGDADAQRELGYCYKYGEGVEIDLKIAVECFTLAAEQGDADAQTELGYCYRDGEGVEIDLKSAVEYFKLAAAQGNDRARFALGEYYESTDFKRAVEFFKLAALQGSDSAQCRLGMYYQYGQSYFGQDVIGKDPKRAAECYRQAAEKGNSQSLSLLAICYSEGHGVPKDIIRAILLLEAQGFQSGNGLPELPDYLQYLDRDFSYHQSSLEKDVKTEAERAIIYSIIGFCHQLGLRTPKELTKAAVFYTEAIDRGAPGALWDLFSCYREMLSSDEGLGRKRLEQFYKDLETPYHSDPQMERERLFFLSYLYENGGPCFEQNLFLALTYYQSHSQLAQGTAGAYEYSKEKVQSFTPLRDFQKGKENVVGDSVPGLSPVDSILKQYTF